MKNKLQGIFHIASWDENAYKENPDGTKQCHAKITQNYTGDIKGSSELQYFMSYQSPQSAVFVGHELIIGKINGKSGSFILQHNGTFEGGVAKSSFEIVVGSAKGKLSGIEGTGEFISGESGQANYQLQIRV